MSWLTKIVKKVGLNKLAKATGRLLRKVPGAKAVGSVLKTVGKYADYIPLPMAGAVGGLVGSLGAGMAGGSKKKSHKDNSKVDSGKNVLPDRRIISHSYNAVSDSPNIAGHGSDNNKTFLFAIGAYFLKKFLGK